MSEQTTEKAQTFPCCRHCEHRALDGQRGGHDRPCECQKRLVTPPEGTN